jgi:hypothetical protein
VVVRYARQTAPLAQGAVTAKKTTGLPSVIPKGSGSKSSPDDNRTVGNEILRDLPADERNLVSSKLESVTLKLHDVLHEPGDPIKFGYFPDSGIVSILSVLSDGKSVEVGLVGREGFVGLPLAVGFSSSPTILRQSVKRLVQH